MPKDQVSEPLSHQIITNLSRLTLDNQTAEPYYIED